MKFSLLGFVTVAFAIAGPVSAADLAFVNGGQSSHVIYHAATAAPSVKLAAQELQRVIQASTKVELPIRTEPASPMICLGDNASARQAGLSPESLPDDSFLISTQGTNLYILGKDYPDDKPTWASWHSRGTLYGVFDFLETAVGVRWLLPGEWGEDIPLRTTLAYSTAPVKKTPDFPIRYLVDIQDRNRGNDNNPQQVRLWLQRQRLPTTAEGRKLQHGHAWEEYIPEKVWHEHPEYLAASADGKRRTFERPANVKFCTTNPHVVQEFAKGVIHWLEAHPNQRSVAISPSDGGDFCDCADCRALLTKDPHGKESRTVAMLLFNNQVARIVGQKHPDRLLGTYVYYNYMYPPEQTLKIEPNLWLVWAPLNYYGWGLQKPVYRQEFPQIIQGWTALTKNFMYHNYSTWFRSLNGAIVPPGFDILKLELPTLHRNGVTGVEMVGLGAWGYGGVSNYLLAKQMWDAEVDVDALYREWLERAYGPGWQSMDQLYQTLETRMKAWKERETPNYSGEQYEINYAVIDNVYRPVFRDLERLYLEAVNKAETTPQRQRLAMFGENLIMLHFNMRHAGMLEEPDKSSFYRTDEHYSEFLKETEFSLALYRDHGRRFTGPIWKGSWQGD